MVRIYFNSHQLKNYSAIDAVCLLGILVFEFVPNVFPVNSVYAMQEPHQILRLLKRVQS